MGFIEIIIVAIIEAMDCFAASIATGLSKAEAPYRRALLQSISFGVFQGGMTMLGYFLGSFAENWFESIATPIASTILCVLGLRLIWGAAHENKECEVAVKNLTFANILLMSIATSIDAFAVGISFAFINVNMYFAITAIAVASFVLAVIGYEMGKHAAKRFKTKIPEILAGLLLIAIGVKMFF